MFNLFQEKESDNSKVKLTTLNFKRNSETVGENIIMATITLRDYILAVVSGILGGYENNRGTGRLNGTKVRYIAENYDPQGVGTITIAEMGDGTWKNADGHHRTAAIIAKYKEEYDCLPFTEAELDQNISLHIISKDDFMKVYGRLNTSHGHSTKHKVLNTDLGLGSMLKDVFELQEEDSVILDSFHTAIARCIYGYIGEFNKPAKELSYSDISGDRKAVSSQAGLTKEEFAVELTNTQKLEIAAALDYVNTTYTEFREVNNGKLNQTGRSLVRNASLFGFIFWDKLSGRELVTYNGEKWLAGRIHDKDALVDKQAKFILNSELRDSAAEKIVGYITTKKRT